MLDVAGVELTAEERERLLHPVVGGVILFSRNYADPGQISRLTAEIHGLRTPSLLIAVDHEGGRVQRFRDGFTRLPPMRELGQLYDSDADAARALAHSIGAVLAFELRGCGVDFSFAPVLDLDHDRSGVIGNRAFHSNPECVGELATALVTGLAEGGMGAVGKHFPGHGYAEADSHVDMPVDARTYDQIERDMQPFVRLVTSGIPGIMPAHVLYAAVDSQPAGYSRFWLKSVLRERLGFDGTIFSDDLTMVGAQGAGGIVERGWLALDAGCEMVLVCNDPPAAGTLLDGLKRACSPVALTRLARLHGRPRPLDFAGLGRSSSYSAAREDVLRRTLTA
ncbi:MAG: beta-N-acetylhexosaminidase [Betaproteobacteria bacterium]